MIARDRILWQRFDTPGLEWCEVRRASDGTRVSGVALVADGGVPHRIDYALEVDAAGRTRRVAIRRPDVTMLELEADPDGRWAVNGTTTPRLAGCVDVDLGFSPMTNSLPIWRLGLAVGETRRIQAAWVRFPDFTIAALPQTYERTGELTYSYRSDGFEAPLRVDAEGIVEEYGTYWRVVARHRDE